MSTKIYDAYKLPNMTLIELSSFCHKVREKIIPEIEQMICEYLAKLCTHILDRNTLGFPIELLNFKQASCVYMNAYQYLRDRVDKIKTTRLRDPEVDFGFSFMIYPTEDKILCQIFSEQRRLIEIFESFPEITDYHYQNQTDKPKEISDEEWEQREKDWDKVFGFGFSGIAIPALCGMAVECYNDFYLFPMISKVLPHISSFEKRCELMACHKVEEEICSEFELLKPKPKDDKVWSWTSECIRFIKEKFKEEQNKDKLKKYEVEFSGKLLKDITVDVLIKDI